MPRRTLFAQAPYVEVGTRSCTTMFCRLTSMLLSANLRSGFALQQPHFRTCCASESRSPCGNGFSQLIPLRHYAKWPLRHSRWRYRSTAGCSRPAPGHEPSGIPDAQAKAPSTNYTKGAAADGRRKGLALLGELKELVKSSNSELKVRPAGPTIRHTPHVLVRPINNPDGTHLPFGLPLRTCCFHPTTCVAGHGAGVP